MKRQICILKNLSILFLIVCFCLPAPAAAKTEKSRKLLKTLVENIHTKENVMQMLTVAGASIESLQVIGKDLDKRMPKNLKLPAMTLKNDEVMIGGKHSGIRVLSYEPLKIKIRSLTWIFDPDKTGDVSYLELVNKMDGKSKPSAMMDLLLPEARAQFFSTMFSGAVSGGAIGALSGAFLGLAVGTDPLTTAIAGGGLGMAFGGLVGANNQNSQLYAPCGRAANNAPLPCPTYYPIQYQQPYVPLPVPAGSLVPPPVR